MLVLKQAGVKSLLLLTKSQRYANTGMNPHIYVHTFCTQGGKPLSSAETATRWGVLEGRHHRRGGAGHYVNQGCQVSHHSVKGLREWRVLPPPRVCSHLFSYSHLAPPTLSPFILRSVLVGRSSGGVPVLMASPVAEYSSFAPLVTSTLKALAQVCMGMGGAGMCGDAGMYGDG